MALSSHSKAQYGHTTILSELSEDLVDVSDVINELRDDIRTPSIDLYTLGNENLD